MKKVLLMMLMLVIGTVRLVYWEKKALRSLKSSIAALAPRKTKIEIISKFRGELEQASLVTRLAVRCRGRLLITIEMNNSDKLGFTSYRLR